VPSPYLRSPLLFWPGIVGSLYYLPVTLIITLMASLLVAFVIEPVFAVSFMKREGAFEGRPAGRPKLTRGFLITMGVLAVALGIC
jgi:multidrug efflux pump subunit AcrB